MKTNRMDTQKIADEAVGVRSGDAIPEVVRQSAAGITDRDIRQRAKSVGPGASMAAKTAEAMGEEANNAYAHGHASSRAVGWTDTWSGMRVGDLPLSFLGVGFVVGYATALLFHRR
jgi:hypothetical protein